MKKTLKVIGLIILSFVIIIGITWIIQGNEFFLYKVFGPANEQVRREVFEQSKAYNQGMVQELQNMEFEYLRTQDPKSREAMASIVLHRSADYDVNKLPMDLRSFIQGLKSKQGVKD